MTQPEMDHDVEQPPKTPEVVVWCMGEGKDGTEDACVP